MSRLALAATLCASVSACFIGGSSTSQSTLGPYTIRSAKACARTDRLITLGALADLGSPTPAVQLADVLVDTTAANELVVYALPKSLAPGSYELSTKRVADGERPSQAATLVISADDPTCVALYTPTLAAFGEQQAVRLTWTTSPAADKYEIWRTTDPAQPFQLVTETDATEHTDRGLASGATYYYQVKAQGDLGTFASLATQATTIPPAPAKLSALGGPSGVEISWAPAQGAQSYEVQRSTNENDYVSAGITTDARFSYDAPKGERAIYRVFARNLAGQSQASVVRPATARSGRAIGVCQKANLPADSGIFTFDAELATDTPAFARQMFDQSLVGPEVYAVACGNDGLGWVFSPRGMVAYDGGTPVGFFRMLEQNAQPRPADRWGRRMAYDRSKDSFVVAGARNGVVSAKEVLYSVSRLLLHEPPTAVDSGVQLNHSTNAIAARWLHGEVVIAAHLPAEGTLHFYDSDTLGVGRRIAGPDTTLGNPVDLAYDPAHDELVVIDSGRLLRFAAAGSGNTAPVWLTPALVESLAIEPRTGDIIALSNTHDKLQRWPRDAAQGAAASQEWPLPEALATITHTHMDYDPTANRVWLVGQDGAAVVVASLPDFGADFFSTEPATIERGDYDASSFAEFAPACDRDATHTRTFTAAAASGPLTIREFALSDGSPPLLSGQVSALALGASGYTATQPIAAFALAALGDSLFVSGMAAKLSGGTYNDYVGAISVGPSGLAGPTLPASRYWLGEQGPATTTIVMSANATELARWSSSGPSFAIFPDALGAPAATGVDSSATNVVAIALGAASQRLFALKAQELRMYTRAGNVAFLAAQALATASATDLALDDFAHELFVANSDGTILVLDADALSPKRTFGGARSGLLPGVLGLTR